MTTVIAIKTLRSTPDGVRTNVVVFPGTVAKVIDTSNEWSKIRLKDSPGAPEGWILSNALSETPPDDIDTFVLSCHEESLFFGVNTHYLVASAKLRSNIQLKGSAGNEIGPFRLLQSEWDAHRQDKVFGLDIASNRITDFFFQCQVFALMTSRAQEAIRAALNGRQPSAVELYLTQLAGATAAAKLINAPATKIDSALQNLPDADLPAGGGTRQQILQRYDEILGGAVATGEEATARIKDALTAACKDTRDAILRAEADALDGGEATVNRETDPESELFQMPSAAGDAPLKGHLILKLQDRLITSGKLPATDLAGRSNRDGFFGGVTKKALQEFQHDNEFPVSGAVTHALWRKLTGEPSPDIYNLCAQLTASFEGTNFGGVNKTNSDNTVLTFGYHGYTLTGGNLQLFLQHVDRKHPGLLDEAFGAANAASLRTLFPPVSLKDAVAIGGGLFLDDPTLGKKAKTKPVWLEGFAKFGDNPAVREEQIVFSRETYFADAEKMRKTLGLAEPLSDALCFDVSIQNGPKREIPKRVAAAFTETMSESDKRKLFAEAIVAVAPADFKNDVRQRKDTLVDGAGRVHDADYRLTNWGFAVPEEAGESELPGSAASQSPNGDFEAFFFQQLPGFTAFAPKEFFVKGGSHEKNGLNTDPPRELWPNVIPLARLLAAFKARLGNKTITFNSVYRSRAYNASLKGSARNSQHMHFKAADIVVHNGQGPRDWAQVLRTMRGEGKFKGGIGTYPTFVHVDTRGFNADWP